MSIYSRKKAETLPVLESANASSEALNHTEDQLAPNKLGFEAMTPEELYGMPSSLGLTRSEELSDSDYSDFFRDPKVMSAFTEHFDITDSKTRKALLSFNETEQTSMLNSLTSKLYDNIVARVDDIDYGDIPDTKGDITKMPNYDKLRECITLMKDILKEFKQDTGPIDTVALALANVESRKDLFGRAFKYNCELPIIMYNNLVLAIVSSVSYMIATSIEFIKVPNQETFQIVLDKVSYSKSRDHMLYKNLAKFNKTCEKNGDFDKAMEYIIQNRIKNFSEAAIAGSFAIKAIGVVGLTAILLNIIPILREFTFFWYYCRMRVSDFFDIQADLLQMNAKNLENNSNPGEDKSHIISKQLKIVEMFRKIANKIAFTSKEAEIKTTREINNNNRKLKIDDIDDSSVSALF